MIQISKLIRKKLGKLLVDEGLLKEEQLQAALKRQRASGETLGEALVGLALLTEMEIARAIVQHFGLPYIDASRYRIPKEAVNAVPRELLWQHQIVVLDKIGKTLLLAISAVLSAEVFEAIEKRSGCQIYVYVATAGQVQATLQKQFPLAAPAGEKK